jgi:hypothetical protein
MTGSPEHLLVDPLGLCGPEIGDHSDTTVFHVVVPSRKREGAPGRHAVRADAPGVGDSANKEEAAAVLIVESGFTQYGELMRAVPHLDQKVRVGEIQAHPDITASVFESVRDQLGDEQISGLDQTLPSPLP